MSAKTNRVNLNLGTSSLLLIFVVLSLVSFAVLSLSSALSDKKLTDKTVDRNIAYYEACNLAQEKIAQLDSSFVEAYRSSSDADSYYKACETIDTDILIPVSDYQGLHVVVEPNYPVNDEDRFCNIVSWKLIYTSEPEIDFSINVVK